MTIDPKQAHLWIVGGGIAGMATAAPAIRGVMVTRGARMFDDEAYQLTWNLFSTIPSLEDPDVTVRQEMLDWNDMHETHGNTRLADARHRIYRGLHDPKVVVRALQSGLPLTDPSDGTQAAHCRPHPHHNEKRNSHDR
ncbi:hypothetical protein E3O19_00995 [Cryobacterium algoritolerans]|uniref:Uncharacterized protein n=1 Tax=Cryobacterium algoritolerans TaxID=1259184 RepID=A0A4R8WZG4_9MICO|nr:oleate hydratase [Cryobacterium algoritolerans]TFC20800.1 hypothetical protein E3O19_00995 [Cryobacterium algoritolerans]